MKLDSSERVVATLRAHPHVLTIPIAFLLVIAGLTGAGLAAMPIEYRPMGQYVVLVLGGCALVWLVARPVLRWVNETTMVTTQRIVKTWGVVWKRRADLPYNRVVSVSFRRQPLDWLSGSGTLLVTTVSGRELSFSHMPHVKDVWEAVSALAADHPVDR